MAAGPGNEEEALTSDKDPSLGSNITGTAVTVAMLSTCSTKCLHRATHVEKILAMKLQQEWKGITSVSVLDSIYGVLNLHCPSIGNNGELFLDDFDLHTSVQGLSL
jgi:hypothetical protein